MNSSEYFRLMAVIRTNLEDDLPRLIMADWLEENSYEERAKYIREEIEINKSYTEYPRTVQSISYRRGFIESVSCTMAGWLHYGPGMVKHNPIERVELTDKEPHQNQIFSTPKYVWFNTDVFGTSAQSHLPKPIFNKMSRIINVYKLYEDRVSAFADLSQACIAWALKQAET